jgi:amidase
MGEPMLGMVYELGLTRTVRDAAHLLDAVQGPGVGDKYTAPPPRGRYADELGIAPGPLRVAVTAEAWSGALVDPQVAAATVRIGRTLEEMGHAVTEACPVLDWDAVMQCTTATAVAIGSTLLMAPSRPDPAKLEAVSRQLLQTAKDYSAVDMMAAFGAQNRVTRPVGAFFTEHDLLITPTLGRLPAPHGTLRYDDPGHSLASWLQSMFDYGPFTMVFNISGQPAISLPLGHSDGGLPIGVQIIAPYGREDLLFQIAYQLEEAMPWDHRTPRVSITRH